MTLEIRPLTPDDRPEWSTLWRDYLAFYDTVLGPEVHDAHFARLLSDDPHEFHGRLAFLDGKAAGLVHYLFHRHGWKIENVVYLQDLYVAPGHRGHGIGEALIRTVYDAADAAGCPTVYWLTQDQNHAARRLYDRIADVTPFIKYQRKPV